MSGIIQPALHQDFNHAAQDDLWTRFVEANAEQIIAINAKLFMQMF